MLNEREYKALKSIFSTLNPVDTAAVLPQFPEREMVMLFRLIPKESAAEVFSYLEPEYEEMLINASNDEELTQLMSGMFADDTADLIEEMPANVVSRILKSVSPQRRNEINNLLHYPEDSAGSLMTTEYVRLTISQTVAEALETIKLTGINKETIYTCYVLDRHRILGTVSAMDLLTSDDDAPMGDIMETNFITVTTDTDKEEVASLFNKYDIISLPVVDHEDCIVGIVTFDDAIDVIEEEAEEDFAIMAATTPSEKPYLKTSALTFFKNRIPWLLFLMIMATFTGIIISKFESALASVIALTAFIPMIMDTGGNSGSQASVAVIRALSLGEVEFSDFFRVIRKELGASVLCGVALGAAAIAKVMIFDYLILSTEGVTLTVALIVGIAVTLTVIFSKVLGACLPMLAEKIGLDPAALASPVITTIIDCLSLFIYFVLASAALGL